MRVQGFIIAVSAAMVSLCLTGSEAAPLATPLSACTEGDEERRIESCTAIIQSPEASSADRIAALDTRGTAYLRKGDLPRALKDFLQISQIDPDLAQPYYRRATLYRSQNDYDDAIREYTALIGRFPKDASAFNERGRSYSIEGDHEHALADYDSALALDPNLGSAHFNRGVARFSTARFAEAAEDFAFATSRDSTNPYPVLWLHLTRLKAHQQDRGELLHNTSGMSAEGWPGILLALYRGEASAKSVQAEAEKQDANTQPNAACHAPFYIGEYEMARGNVNAAVPVLQDAVQKCPHDGPEYDAAIAELSWLP